MRFVIELEETEVVCVSWRLPHDPQESLDLHETSFQCTNVLWPLWIVLKHNTRMWHITGKPREALRQGPSFLELSHSVIVSDRISQAERPSLPTSSRCVPLHGLEHGVAALASGPACGGQHSSLTWLLFINKVEMPALD